MSKTPPRERLLEALDVLAARRSALDVGINEVLARAGVARASLYTHYGSKDALLVAWLARRQEQWFGWFEAHIVDAAPSGQPGEELDAMFGFLEAWLAREDFAGCPFVRLGLQAHDPSSAPAVQARAYAERLYEMMAQRVSAMGCTGAESLVSVFLGAVTMRELGLGSEVGAQARRAARDLIGSSRADQGA